MATTPFLARLQLDTDADARAIRRAYARELKLIDQAADAGGFQALRECYERALAWAEQGTRGDERTPAAPPSAPSSAPSHEGPAPIAAAAAGPAAPPAHWQAGDPAVLAQAVFAELCAALGEPAPGPAAWVDALRRLLADPRLELLEAHERFEGLVAHLLAVGWRPGHEALLPAAAQVFGWDADRRTLRRLQRDGMLLAAALDQQALFEAQPESVRKRQHEVLTMLRKPAPPSEQTMSNLIVALRTLAGRYPHWLGLVAPAGAVRHWLERCAQAEAPQAVGPSGGAPKLDMRRTTPGVAGAVVLVLWLLSSVVRHMGDAPTYTSPPNADTVKILEEVRRRALPPRQDQHLTREQAEAIAARIHYRPSAGTAAGPQDTQLEVYLDDDGNMVGVKWLKRSNDPALSDAVEKGLHDSGPYPRALERVFVFGYQVDVRAGAKTLHRPARPMRERAPWEPLRPTHPGPAPHAGPWPPLRDMSPATPAAPEADHPQAPSSPD